MIRPIVCLVLFLLPGVFAGQELPAIPRNHLPLFRLELAKAPAPAAGQNFGAAAPDNTSVSVVVNKSIVLENTKGVRRISIANPEIAEGVAASTTEVLVNGKAPGETTLILWDQSDHRTIFDVHVLPNSSKLDAVRHQLTEEFPGQDLAIAQDGGEFLLRGTANDLVAADRAVSIASSLGKVINLLNVTVPSSDPQILLKVRFASIDRSALSDLGANFFSTGASPVPGSITTGQFGGPPAFDFSQFPPKLSLPDALNLFVFSKDLNFGTYIKALQTKGLVQILAEPNLLTLSGHEANFLAGGEFPYPMLQGGGSGLGQITIEFREFGIRLRFRPTVTPRGTIRLMVNPEVSALDPANGLTVQGYTVPGLSTRRVQTEIEVQNGQSFLIAGLLDNRLTETISKIPGLSDLPILGKLFQSRSLLRNNSELLVVVTPEIVQPIPPGTAPNLAFPKPFMKDVSTEPPQNPTATGAAASIKAVATVPVEVLKGIQAAANAQDTGDGSGANGGSTPSQTMPTGMQPTSIGHN